MSIPEISIDSSIEEKIQWAEDCYQNLGAKILQDDKIKALLLQFRKTVKISHKEMSIVGVGDECRECVEKEGGSCCGAGLENRYTGRLLLINLMLNRALPRSRKDPKGCYFLGDQGCTLLARQVICVNYICKKITDHIDPDDISALREKEGVELGILFILNERIKEQLILIDQTPR